MTQELLSHPACQLVGVTSTALFADFLVLLWKLSPSIQMVLCVALMFCVLRLRALLAAYEGKDLLKKGKEKQRYRQKENP